VQKKPPPQGLAGVSLGRQIIPECFAQEFPMFSEVAPCNIRTIRGVALFPIFCRWRFLCHDQPWMTGFRSGPPRRSPEEYYGSLTAASSVRAAMTLKEVQDQEELETSASIQAQVQLLGEQLSTKDNQIQQLHVLLQQTQAMLPAPREHRSWWHG